MEDGLLSGASGGFPVPNPNPRQAPQLAPLRDAELPGFELVPLDLELHASELFRLSHGTDEIERTWAYLPYGPFESEEQLCDHYRSLMGAGDPLFYVLLERGESSPVGVSSYLAIEPAHGCIEIGHIWYAPAWQRTLAGTTACFLLLQHAFVDLGYRRLEWKCDALNTRSRAAALRLGFRFEGLFRQHRIVNGINRDTTWFSILDGEWPRVGQAMRDWLLWDESSGERPSLGSLRGEDSES